MITPRYHVALDDGLDNVIVVDGVPVIDKSKLEKLLAKISKEFTKKGAALKPENTFVPWDNASGKSKGCADTIVGIGNVANRPPPATSSSIQAAQTQQHLRSPPCMVILSIQSIPSLSTDSPILNNMRIWRKHMSSRRQRIFIPRLEDENRHCFRTDLLRRSTFGLGSPIHKGVINMSPTAGMM